MSPAHQLSLFTDERLPTIVNVASVPQRSPFRYPGGKTWLRHRSPRPALLLEPFAGGGIIGLTAGFERLAEPGLVNNLRRQKEKTDAV